MKLYLTISRPAQLDAACETKADLIFVDSAVSEADDYASLCRKIHDSGKEAGLILPRIFRDKARAYFGDHLEAIVKAGFDAFLIPSLEGLGYLKENGFSGRFISDSGLYAFNPTAVGVLLSFGIDVLTLPVELNERDIRELPPDGMILPVYGRQTMMISANCLQNTLRGCDRKPHRFTMTDRMGNRLPAVNCCRYCMNTIYNALPLSLADASEAIRTMGLAAARLDFTLESPEEVLDITDLFYRRMILHENTDDNVPAFTRGHFRRGVQ